MCFLTGVGVGLGAGVATRLGTSVGALDTGLGVGAFADIPLFMLPLAPTMTVPFMDL